MNENSSEELLNTIIFVPNAFLTASTDKEGSFLAIVAWGLKKTKGKDAFSSVL